MSSLEPEQDPALPPDLPPDPDRELSPEHDLDIVSDGDAGFVAARASAEAVVQRWLNIQMIAMIVAALYALWSMYGWKVYFSDDYEEPLVGFTVLYWGEILLSMGFVILVSWPAGMFRLTRSVPSVALVVASAAVLLSVLSELEPHTMFNSSIAYQLTNWAEIVAVALGLFYLHQLARRYQWRNLSQCSLLAMAVVLLLGAVECWSLLRMDDIDDEWTDLDSVLIDVSKWGLPVFSFVLFGVAVVFIGGWQKLASSQRRGGPPARPPQPPQMHG